MREKQNPNLPWLTCSTGLAFGVVLGGSLTLALAPALPVAVGVIATTTIIWGFIGYLAEEYQKDNLKNGYNISSPSPSRRFSKKAGEHFATPPKTHKDSLKTGLVSSDLETKSILESQRYEGEIGQEHSPIQGRALFSSPTYNSRKDSVNLDEITFVAPEWDKTIFDTHSPFPMKQERRFESPSPSKTGSRSPIYVSGHPKLTADLVLCSQNPLATNPTRPEYYLETPERDVVSKARIKAMQTAIKGRGEDKREDSLSSEMRRAGEKSQYALVQRGWEKIASGEYR